MSRRSRAREVVVQLLYQQELSGDIDTAWESTFLIGRLHGDLNLVDFAKRLLYGVRRFQDQIDATLKPLALRWNLNRMAAVDRNLLRLGIYEILYGDTPKAVAIDEAVRLAKRYGSAQSFQFVNGILDRVQRAAIEHLQDGSNFDAEPLGPANSASR